MNIFQRYEIEFQELVRTAYTISCKRSIKSDDKFSNALAKMMLGVKHLSRTKIDKRDIEQQLALLWLEWHRQYREKKPRTDLKNYLLRRSVWGLRDWLRREMAGSKGFSLATLKANSRQNKHILDLYWLLKGDTEDGPLYMLKAYERYLLYLRHVCGYTIGEIAERVFKSRGTVRLSLVKIISKIRSYSNAEADPSRPCD